MVSICRGVTLGSCNIIESLTGNARPDTDSRAAPKNAGCPMHHSNQPAFLPVIAVIWLALMIPPDGTHANPKNKIMSTACCHLMTEMARVAPALPVLTAPREDSLAAAAH